jgi:mannose-6-phosphate isomerase-like protein (cupin superfamily)
MYKIFAFLKMIRLLYTRFHIADSFPIIEIGPFGEREPTYSLVYLSAGEFPQHIHDDSDARFFFHSGEGVVVMGEQLEEIPFTSGSIVEAPRGIPHGFKVTKPGIFMVWQSVAITNPKTGVRDIRYVDPECSESN